MKNLLEKLADKIADLINVKTFITFGVTVVFCYLSIKGENIPEFFKTVFIMLLSFYFGTQFEKNAQSKRIEESNDETEETGEE